MKKILVVDDDISILEVVEIILTSNGFDVRTHTNGYHVEKVVNDYNPDLILLDIKLPGKSGTEICRELKQLNSKTPIILFSAHGEKLGKEIATSCSDNFIQKPFDIKDLMDTIRLYLN